MIEYNEEQKKAIEFEGDNLLVLAGAGSGKTRTIIARVGYLIEKGVAPNKILVLSFTRKASGEVKERIFAQSNQKPMVFLFQRFITFVCI